MFEGLTERLQTIFGKLRTKGKLSEQDVLKALREIRMALLEADVHYRVAKEFLERVRERAVGQEVMRSLTPAQQVLKVVKEELEALMAGDHSLGLKGDPPVIMLVGLQGSGKTTTAAKLALRLKKQGMRPFLVPLDPYRPAAAEQLQRLAERVGVACFGDVGGNPLEAFLEARERAKGEGLRPMILDTAGRLHIDEELMQELRELKEGAKPSEVLLVADAMTGQDAVNVARGFEEGLGITGVILTKLDGDARGGAALSIKAVTGKPIKFVGVGEGVEALEPFYPDRMASRILGMGDVLTLIEKAQEAIQEEEARRLEEKIRRKEFDLEDFREHLRMLRRMGSLDDLLGMIPGLSRFKGIRVDEKRIVRMEAIINSMTVEERKKPHIIDGSRRRRIARGSGTTVQEVNQLLRQFEAVRKMLKEMQGSKGRRWFRLLQ
ncbi:MAG: signal recognition particle protein [Deltaproteobacteria bacterium]|nr:MAG: signal recognition particle protein [Deltaproteobacteria bacterium]